MMTWQTSARQAMVLLSPLKAQMFLLQQTRGIAMM
jgi:hypothetical protein